MKLLLSIILFFSMFALVAQSSQQTTTPVQILYGKRTTEERRRGPVHSGVLNSKVVSKVLPTYPMKAKDKALEGTVEIQILVNEDGEVIFANPLSGPEELWAESVKAAVTAQFSAFTLAGNPAKREGRLIYDFKNGNVTMP